MHQDNKLVAILLNNELESVCFVDFDALSEFNAVITTTCTSIPLQM